MSIEKWAQVLILKDHICNSVFKKKKCFVNVQKLSIKALRYFVVTNYEEENYVTESLYPTTNIVQVAKFMSLASVVVEGRG